MKSIYCAGDIHKYGYHRHTFFYGIMDLHAAHYKIGYVAKTHGLKGEVTVIITDGINLNLLDIKSVFIEVNGALVPYFITHISDRGDKAFVKLEDVDGPEDAARLKGCSLYQSKKSRLLLDRGEFYDDEVIGYEVMDEKLGTLGAVREILQIGRNRLIAVTGVSREILIPVNGPFIKGVNKTKRKFSVDLPEGFLDI